MASGRSGFPPGSAPLRCECRRTPTFERGLVRWSFALLILGAAALDAFWVIPAQEHHARQLRLLQCKQGLRAAPPIAARELRVIDVQLLTPSQAAR